MTMYRIFDNDENRWAYSGDGKEFDTREEAIEWVKETLSKQMDYLEETNQLGQMEWYKRNYPSGHYSLYEQITGDDPAIY